MYLCYIDESGTPEVPGNTSHFVLAGLSIPISEWRSADREISLVLARYGLENEEIHTGWIAHRIFEQTKIADFAQLDWPQRRSAVQRLRTTRLLALQKQRGGAKAYRQAKKNYSHTEAYIHLTHDERMSALRDVADTIAGWAHARLFVEAIDKTHFDPLRTGRAVDEQAFEQVVSRFQHFLSSLSKSTGSEPVTVFNYGLLVHDNNQTVAQKHTALMRQFHNSGTLWTSINNIIETPMFVDSKLTRMVQIADLCAYSLRRYVENGETDLFRRVFKLADKIGGKAVSVRHFAGLSCQCEICEAHHRGKWSETKNSAVSLSAGIEALADGA